MPWTKEINDRFHRLIRQEAKHRWFKAIILSKTQPVGEVRDTIRGIVGNTYLAIVINYKDWNLYFSNNILNAYGENIPEAPAPWKSRGLNKSPILLEGGLRYNGWNVEEIPT